MGWITDHSIIVPVAAAMIVPLAMVAAYWIGRESGERSAWSDASEFWSQYWVDGLLRNFYVGAKKAQDYLIASSEEVESMLALAFDGGALDEDTIMRLAVDPHGILSDFRAAIRAAKGTGRLRPGAGRSPILVGERRSHDKDRDECR